MRKYPSYQHINTCLWEHLEIIDRFYITKWFLPFIGYKGSINTQDIRERPCIVGRCGNSCHITCKVFSSCARGAVLTTRNSVPCKAVSLARLASPCSGWFDSVEMAWDSIGIASGCTIAREVVFGMVSTEEAPSRLRGIWGVMGVAKGRLIILWFILVGCTTTGLLF